MLDIPRLSDRPAVAIEHIVHILEYSDGGYETPNMSQHEVELTLCHPEQAERIPACSSIPGTRCQFRLRTPLLHRDTSGHG